MLRTRLPGGPSWLLSRLEEGVLRIPLLQQGTIIAAATIAYARLHPPRSSSVGTFFMLQYHSLG